MLARHIIDYAAPAPVRARLRPETHGQARPLAAFAERWFDQEPVRDADDAGAGATVRFGGER